MKRRILFENEDQALGFIWGMYYAHNPNLMTDSSIDPADEGCFQIVIEDASASEDADDAVVKDYLPNDDNEEDDEDCRGDCEQCLHADECDDENVGCCATSAANWPATAPVPPRSTTAMSPWTATTSPAWPALVSARMRTTATSAKTPTTTDTAHQGTDARHHREIPCAAERETERGRDRARQEAPHQDRSGGLHAG